MAPMGIEPMISPLLGERGADCAKAPSIFLSSKKRVKYERGYYGDL